MSDRISTTMHSAFPTARIALVLLEERDALHIAQWLNDPDVTRTLSINRVVTISAEQEWLKKCYQGENILFGIWLQKEQKLIGTTGWHNIDYRSGTATFGIMIGDRDEWRKGYGTEIVMQMLHYAFMRKNLRTVSLDVLGNNPAAQRCYAKCGFRECGRLAAYESRDGEHVDRITMQAFRREWLVLLNAWQLRHAPLQNAAE